MVKWIAVVLLVSGCSSSSVTMAAGDGGESGADDAGLSEESTGGAAVAVSATGGAPVTVTGGRQTGGSATSDASTGGVVLSATGGAATGGTKATGGRSFGQGGSVLATGGTAQTGGLATGGRSLLVATGGAPATGGTIATGGNQPTAGAGSCPATDIDGALLPGAHAGDTCVSLGSEKHYCTTIASAAAIYCVACTENLLNCDTPTILDHCGTRIDKLNCGRCGQKCSNTQTCQPFAGMYACISSS